MLGDGVRGRVCGCVYWDRGTEGGCRRFFEEEKQKGRGEKARGEKARGEKARGEKRRNGEGGGKGKLIRSQVYNKVTIKWTTHSARVLTEKDIDMARACDKMAEEIESGKNT